MKSGRASFDLLYNNCDKFFIFDENVELQNKLLGEFCFHVNVFVIKTLDKIVLSGIDQIIISPSISIYDPRLKYAKRHNIEVLPEIELGTKNTKNNIVAVTGTNGKTTTVNLIYAILKNAHKRTELVGNVGIPLCEKVRNEKRHTTYVLEVSSFQLESIKTFKPKIACILNITADHLDRHKTMANYTKLKKKIFQNMTKSDFVVLNENLKNIKSSCKTFVFGKKNVKFGCYVDNDNIIFSNGKKQSIVCTVSKVALTGAHNLENVLCAVCVAKLLKIKNRFIRAVLCSFHAGNHRIQKVYSKINIDFYDDSKGTNVGATICAMETLQNGRNTMLILGGKDKGDEFDDIFRNLASNITKILVVGEAKEKILTAGKRCGHFDKLLAFECLKDATIFACEQLKPNEQLLLSPACSSFDEFQNYHERGEKFLEYIKGYYEIS